jgi:hypothetical protein
MQRAPKPATWSTTWGLSVQNAHRNQPRGRAAGQNPHRTPVRGRPPDASRCSARRSPPRGRAPADHQGPLDAISASNPRTWADDRIEPRDVVDHLGNFDAARAEGRHVVDHLGPFGAECASKPAAWASSRPESASNPRTWSTTRRLSMHRAPKASTWATTWGASMQVAHRRRSSPHLCVNSQPRSSRS